MQNYEKLQKENRLKRISIVFFLTGSLYLTQGIADIFLSPDNIREIAIIMHLFIMPAGLFTVALLAYLRKNHKLIETLIFLSPLVANVLHIYVLSHFDDYNIYNAEVYISVFWIFTVSNMHFRAMLVSASIVVLLSFFSSLYLYDFSAAQLFQHSIWLLASFSFGLSSAYLLKQSNQTVQSQHKELHIQLTNKNILLKELFHRVKNNLQVISGILYMQSRKINNEEMQLAYQNSIQTIKAMGMIHEKLSKSNDLTSIDFNEYVNDLVSYINLNSQKNKIIFSIKCESIPISIEQAVPLGLITNEILTNSIKYAFKEEQEKKLINIRLFLDDDNIALEISDNGVGIDFENFEKNFGFTLIHSLATQQLKGSCECFNDNGLAYIIRINPNEIY